MIELKPLIGKLSRTCSDALERAAGSCLAAGNFAVEIEHLFAELAEQADSDFARALDRYEVDRRGLADALRGVARRYPGGNGGNPGVSDHLAAAMEKAWGVASIDLGRGAISSACLLRAAIEDRALRDRLLGSVPGFSAVPRDRLGEELAEIVSSGREGSGGGLVAGGMLVPGEGSPLDAYTIDLTKLAREGSLDPVIGRDGEIDQVIEILMRRRQNNPILTGDAGVGKTAVVEGLAQRIAAGQVPEALAGVAVRSLDLGLLQAGASVKGEYERRLRGVIAEVNGAPDRTVLFIDEAHMLIGAGGAAGQGDAANLLKPALARGGLRTIAATTWAEYKRYFEKDAALARRFHPVKIEQPDAPTTITILRQLSGRLERFHNVRIGEDALAAAAQLSQRYIAERKLPDKAINVLDTACARVAIAQSCRPPALDAAEARLADVTAEIERLATRGGGDAEDRLDQLEVERDEAQDARDAIASRWEQERCTFDRLHKLEKQADADDPELQGLRLELAEIQEEGALVPLAVDRRAVAEVVSAWTGVPLEAILGSASSTAQALKAQLAERIVGQEDALDTIVRRVQTFQAGLGDPGKPTGVFLLCGPSGVGKTETALALADLLFGGQRALITVNMSEYQAAHSVSGLKGAPPGYVGYGKGGVLTEAVRRQPYSVVLLDEIEKAHPDVLEIFYQVFDRGMLEDSEGVAVDFTHTLILLTSNLGADLLAAGAPAEAIQAELARHLAPAFLARLVVVPYRPLAAAEIEAIVRLKLARIGERFAAARRGELTYDEQVVKAIARAADIADGGARSVDAIIAHQLLPELSIRLLDRLAEAAPARAAHLSVASDGRLRIDVSR
jgi:type VI secretion system protein VasG